MNVTVCYRCRQEKPRNGHSECRMCRNVMLLKARNPNIEGHIERKIATLKGRFRHSVKKIDYWKGLLQHFRKMEKVGEP